MADEAMFKNVPQPDRAAILELGYKLIEKRKEQVRLQERLQLAMIQEWTRMDELKIDRDGFFELLARYYKAVEEKQEQFVWRERDFVTGYAKYLLQYLETQLRLDESSKMKIRRMRAAHLTRMPMEETAKD